MKIRLILVLLTLQTLLIAKTFEWKSSSTTKTVPKPLEEISSIIESEMAKVIYTRNPIDLSAAIPPEVKRPELPPEVEKPELPTSYELIRGEFERTKDFNHRVQLASEERDRKLRKIQEKYRQKVEARNAKIKTLSQEYSLKIKDRNIIIKRLQELQAKNEKELEVYFKKQEKKALQKIDIYAADAVDKVYGKPKLTYKSYNPDTDTMQLLLTSSDGKNFQKEISLTMEPTEAKKLRDELNKVIPKIIFDAKLNGVGNVEFTIKEISLDLDQRHYVANDTTSEYVYKPVRVTIDTVTDFNAHENKLIIQENTTFQLQDPSLKGGFSLGAVAYTEEGAIIGVNELYNEAQSIKATRIDPHKWLFMIAIENYRETEGVDYADRSAVAMEAVLQKRLGISDANTISLIDNEATSGAIKDKFQKVLRRLKSEDTIYFYYSGHGVPSKSGDAYILPSDKTVDYIADEPFFKLENIYARLSDSKAKHSFAFIDACFSGRTDGKMLFKGVAPALITTKRVPYDKEKMTIITAGRDDEFSNMYEEKRYRLFSYYLSRALLNDVTDVRVLYNKVKANVLEKSQERGSRYEQTPQIYGVENIRLY